MLRLSLFARNACRASNIGNNCRNGFITSMRHSIGQPAMITIQITCGSAPLLVTTRLLNMNQSVRTKWQIEQENAGRNRTDYDLDKEQWMKQMKFASMDCIIDPDISPVRYTSIAGIRRIIKQFITMRKLKDRRPDYNTEELKSIFCNLKRLSHDNSMDVLKQLQRLTTHGEATRIAKEIKTRMNENFAKKSWKALRQQASVNSYEIEIDEFTLVNCFLGQMYEDDWLQTTYKCVFRERESSSEEWRKVTEFPVFEVHLTDGVRNIAKYPFIIVGIIKTDGTRYGRDTQDASELRKQFNQQKRWKERK